MDPKHYAALRALYDQVIDLPAGERAGKLRELGADEATAADVMALILPSETDFAAQIAKPIQRMLAEKPSPLNPGDTLGVWRVDREIGQGGMGSVYLVERVDGHFKQTAALKFVKGLPRTDALRFFSRERQLLATLTHPNIARLLDGGASAEGQPYLVMEYVDGVAIDAYCRERKLDTAAILRLFAAACDAVAFAHRQLIVHCDLKPSNLMINRDGRPVLLDFGIARMLDRAGAEANDAGIGSSVAYTPRYASPEQREHGVVSTVSDIYGLGIMLGELLGEHAQGNPEIRAMLAKATANEPANRYATVDALTGDIDRFLHKQPLAAMPPAMPYLTKKFLQRRWPLVLAGAAFAGTVMGFTWRVIEESRHAQAAEKVALAERDATQVARKDALTERDTAQRERDRAQLAEAGALKDRDAKEVARREALSERDRARAAESVAVAERRRATEAQAASRQTNAFLISIFDSSNPNAESGDIPASKLIAAAEARVEKEMQGQPATKAEIYSALGVVQANMGHAKEAVANLDRAIALERKLNRPLVLAEMLARYDKVVSESDGPEASEAQAKEALALREKYADPNSLELADSRAAMAVTANSVGRTDEAARLFTQSLATLEKYFPGNAVTADTYVAYGEYLRTLGKLQQAVEYYERGVKASAIAYGEMHPSYLTNYEVYGRGLAAVRRLDEAEAVFRRALELRKKLHGSDNILVANVMTPLANLLNDADRPREALQIVNEVLPIIAKNNGVVSLQYIGALNQQAASYNYIGDYERAVKAVEEAVGIAEKLGVKGAVLPNLLSNLGSFQMRAGRMADAHKSLLACQALRRATYGDSNTFFTVDTEINLADWHVRSGQWAEAAARLDQIQRFMPIDNPFYQFSYDRLRAWTAAGKGDFATAITALEKVEQARFKARGDKSPLAWLSLVDRAEVLALRGAPEDKIKSAQLATDILAKVSPTFVPSSPIIARLKQLQRPQSSE